MKEIAFKNLTSTKRRRKVISLTERNEKQGCEILSQKTLIYIVSPSAEKVRALAKPEYYIYKSFDSKKKQEKFSLRVKGTSYIVQDSKLLKVDFCHSLKIEIKPATH